jgi:hypothetical protein
MPPISAFVTLAASPFLLTADERKLAVAAVSNRCQWPQFTWARQTSQKATAGIVLRLGNVTLKFVANRQRALREILKRANLTPHPGGGAASTIGEEQQARTHTYAGNFHHIAPAARPMLVEGAMRQRDGNATWRLGDRNLRFHHRRARDMHHQYARSAQSLARQPEPMIGTEDADTGVVHIGDPHWPGRGGSQRRSPAAISTKCECWRRLNRHSVERAFFPAVAHLIRLTSFWPQKFLLIEYLEAHIFIRHTCRAGWR